MANNPILYNAALSGAAGGLSSERWPSSTQSIDYVDMRNSAVVFATAVDAAIPTDADYTQQHGELLEAICSNILAARGSAGSSTSIAVSIATLFNILKAQLETVSAAAAVALLTNVRYVDVGTDVELEDQTGSMSAPFASMQGALDSMGAATNAVIYAVPGDYTAQTLVPSLTLETLFICSLGYIPQHGREFGEAVFSIPLVALPLIDATAKSYGVILAGCTPAGFGPGGGLLVAGSLTASGCNLLLVALPEASNYLYGCVAVGGNPVGQTYMDSCHFFNGGQLISESGPIEIVNTTCNPASAVDIGFTTPPGELILDQFTYAELSVATLTLTGVTLIVEGLNPTKTHIGWAPSAAGQLSNLLTVLPAGHAPGLYQVSISQMVATVAAASFGQETVTWSNSGAKSISTLANAFGTPQWALLGLAVNNSASNAARVQFTRTIYSDGVDAITARVTAGGTLAAPAVIDLYASAILMGTQF